ncbi:MAG: DUF3570 domain-containing protein [Opitutaceae bacterium]|nr:DUF3570 domain-containing protein [Opitutaceae bacterium]
MNLRFRPALRAAALSTLLLWLAPRAARAEEYVRYKYQDYRETGGRVAIEVHSVALEKDLGPTMHLRLEGVIDAITGATPSGQPAPAGSDQVPLSKLTDRRKAWNGALSRQFGRVNVTLGAGNSRESDYVSDGWSLSTLTDFNQKNTTLLAGVAGTHDDVKVFFQRSLARKRTNDLILGVTQLLDPRTSATFNITWGRQTGYLSDPYKLVQKDTELFPGISLPLTFPENRPNERDKWVALAALNRAFPAVQGAIDASWRYYRDTFGLTSHTIELAWFQRLGESVILRPGLRLYDQRAADFYYYRLEGRPIVPVQGPPRPHGPFYSSDWRLSALRSVNYGVKLIWTVSAALEFDAAFEIYDMRGRDGVTPQSAYSRANILTLGAKFSW